MTRYADPVVGRSPPIQGLRALAVVSVIIFHLNPAWLPGGFLGVDIFFVISGLLIARMLANDINTSGRVQVLRFYGKRLYRIAPAALTVTVASVPMAYLALLPFDLKDYGASMVGVTTLTLNKMIANNIGYFSPLAETQPLLHFWSLMVEIHFYLLIPLVFYLFRSLRVIQVAMLGLLIVSLIYSDWLSSWDPKDSYFLLPSRAWELLFGVLLFLFMATRENPRTGVRWISWLQWLLVVSLVGCLWLFSASTRHPSFLSVAPVFATGALIWSVLSNPASPLARLFSAQWLVLLGNMSFSLYLWHYPFIVFFKADTGSLSYGDMVLAVFGTLVCSATTYLTIERPSFSRRRVSNLILKRPLSLSGVAASVAIVGVYGFLSNGLESSWVDRQPETVKTAYRLSRDAIDFRRHDEETDCIFRVEAFDELVQRRFDRCGERHGRGILIVGDSHAIGVWRLATALNKDTHPSEPFLVGITRGGCKPYGRTPGCSYERLTKSSDYLGQIFSRIIYVQAGSSLLLGDDLKRNNIEIVVQFLESLAKNVSVSWLGPRVEPNIDPRRFVRLGCEQIQTFDYSHGRRIKRLNDYISKSLESSTVTYISNGAIDLTAYGSCEALFWRDSNHWSPAGIDRISSNIKLIDLVE